jgi:hypothetical protein
VAVGASNGLTCFKENDMTAKTLEDAIARNHAALDSMLKGDCSGYVALLSDRDDV